MASSIGIFSRSQAVASSRGTSFPDKFLTEKLIPLKGKERSLTEYFLHTGIYLPNIKI
jgi:hypothetical protein